MSDQLDPSTKQIIDRIFAVGERRSRQKRQLKKFFGEFKFVKGSANYKEFLKGFVLQVINYLELEVKVGMNARQEDVEALLLKAKKIADDDEEAWERLRQSDIPTFKHRWYRAVRATKRTRRQVVYGVLGVHPEFMDFYDDHPDYEAYRSFVIERRFRTIMRMQKYVNGLIGRRGYFFYPHQCDKPERKLFDTDSRFRSELDSQILSSDLRTEFRDKASLILSNDVYVAIKSNASEPVWWITDKEDLKTYVITYVVEASGDKLEVAEQGYNNKYRLNTEAMPAYWQYANKRIADPAQGTPTPDPSDDKHPFILTPSGQQEPDVAIDKLFVLKRTCDANLLDCAFASTAVLIDSLMVANDRQRRRNLLTEIRERQTDEIKDKYITVDHPEGTWVHYSREYRDYMSSKGIRPPFHIIMDKSTRSALFEYASINLKALQVGDRVYLYNHPLYSTFRPNGAWRGEHAIVRDLRSGHKDSIHFEGHGMSNKTLPGLYALHFDELNTWINMLVRVVQKHLSYLKAHGENEVDDVKVIQDKPKPGQMVYLYPFVSGFGRFKYWDYEARRNHTVKGFVIVQPPLLENKFYIERILTEGKVQFPRLSEMSDGGDLSEIKTDELVTIERRPNGPSGAFHDIEYWGIEYTDKAVGVPSTKKFFYLSKWYRQGSRRLKAKIKVDDIVEKSLFVTRSRRNDPVDVTVTRPKVFFDDDYIEFLKSASAF